MFKSGSTFVDELNAASVLESVDSGRDDSSLVIKLIGIRKLDEADACTNEAFTDIDDEAIDSASRDDGSSHLSPPPLPNLRFLSDHVQREERNASSDEYEEPLGVLTSDVTLPVKMSERSEDCVSSNSSGQMKRVSMDEVSLDSFYVPPVSRKYEAYEDDGEDENGGKGEATLHKRGRFRVFWRNIVYRINTFSLMNHVVNIAMNAVPKSYERIILSRISGSFESGKVTALMGPSGAGKTTLLECLIGKRVRGLAGEINIESIDRTDTSGDINDLSHIQMAIIPQLDSFFDGITPREAIGYASKLKNTSQSVNHDEIVQELIERLELNSCCELQTNRLSGSERKRLSIACDLVSKPNLLVLDEPTTGLDAYAARKLCELLNQLATERNLAILMTVHQPSWAIFLTFHKIYMLSPVIGRAIYEGPPHRLIQHLAAFDLHCPKQTNASDFLTEIAFGRARKQQLIDLADHHQVQFDRLMQTSRRSHNLFRLLEKNVKSFPFFTHAYILASRFALTFTRDLFNLIVSMILAGLLAAIFCVCFAFSGESDGCPPDLSKSGPMNNTFFNQLLIDTTIEEKEVRKNISIVLLIQVVMMMITLTPVLVLIPQELKIYWKEVKNSYYSPLTLFLAKTFFEVIIDVLLVSYLECIIYFGTKQRFISDTKGFSGFIGIFEGLYFLALIIQSQGTIVAILLAQSPDSVIIGGNMLVIVNALFSSVFAPVAGMSVFAQIIGTFVPARWIGPLTITGLYGHNRCDSLSPEQSVNIIKGKVETWLTQITRVTDSHMMTPFTGDNVLLGQVFQDQQFALNNLTYSQYREVTKQYVDSHGKRVRYYPMALVNMSIDYDDDVPARLMLIVHLILFRLASYLLISYATKKSE